MAINVSTINKTGEDYATLTLWEDDTDYDLVTATTIEEADCYDDDGALVDYFGLGGATTSSSYYRIVTAPSGERHSGKLSDGSAGTGFLLKRLTWLDGNIISVGEENVQITWLQIQGQANQYVYGLHFNSRNSGLVKNCIIANMQGYGIKSYTDWTGPIIENCIFQGTTMAIGVYIQYGSGTVYNCSSVGPATGFSGTATTVYKNCLANNNATAGWAGSAAATSTNNLAEDTTTPEYNTYYDSKSLTFVDAGNDDYHLASTDTDAIDHGADLSGTFTDDIDGDTRSGTWDIGADEYAGGASSSPSTSPSASPSATPSTSPSASPSATPSASPSASPSATPSATPSASPSASPSVSSSPSASPSATPSATPSESPSASPSATPSASPSVSSSPSSSPSATPSATPSASPSASPSTSPSASPSPSATPSASPSASPSATPSATPSTSPSASPSATPSATPSVSPSASPSATPSSSPSASPSATPSSTPSASPSVSPSATPSATPSTSPSASPSATPSTSPSASPSASPSGAEAPNNTYIVYEDTKLNVYVDGIKVWSFDDE